MWRGNRCTRITSTRLPIRGSASGTPTSISAPLTGKVPHKPPETDEPLIKIPRKAEQLARLNYCVAHDVPSDATVQSTHQTIDDHARSVSRIFTGNVRT